MRGRLALDVQGAGGEPSPFAEPCLSLFGKERGDVAEDVLGLDRAQGWQHERRGATCASTQFEHAQRAGIGSVRDCGGNGRCSQGIVEARWWRFAIEPGEEIKRLVAEQHRTGVGATREHGGEVTAATREQRDVEMVGWMLSGDVARECVGVAADGGRLPRKLIVVAAQCAVCLEHAKYMLTERAPRG